MLPSPVIEVPGYKPRSPLIVVGPVLVTVEAPRTAKLDTVPSVGAVCANIGLKEIIARSKATRFNDNNGKLLRSIRLAPPVGKIPLVADSGNSPDGVIKR